MDTYKATPPAPSITSIFPADGDACTKLHVMIKGLNFDTTTPAINLIKPGVNPISANNINVINSTNIACDLPLPCDALRGYWNVTVTNPSTTLTGVLPNSFHLHNNHVPISADFVVDILQDGSVLINSTNSLNVTSYDGDQIVKYQFLDIQSSDNATLLLNGQAVSNGQEVAKSDVDANKLKIQLVPLTLSTTTWGFKAASSSADDSQIVWSNKAKMIINTIAVPHGPLFNGFSLNGDQNSTIPITCTKIKSAASNVPGSNNPVSYIQVASTLSTSHF